MEFLNVPIDPNRLKCTVESNMQAKFKRQVSQDVHFMCDWISEVYMCPCIPQKFPPPQH